MGLGDHGSATSTNSQRWHLTPREQGDSPTRAKRDFIAYLARVTKCNRHTPQ
jgi:hypothetical protein